MTLHLHQLWGCAPAPLAHYLKALGILRVLGEQRDPEARGFWKDEHFCLLTTLDRAELERFFLEDYSPTAFLSPWNKGSGFLDPKDAVLEPFETSSATRFASFRAGIAAGRAPLRALQAADAAVRALKARTKATGKGAAAAKAATALKADPSFKKELAAAERTFRSLKADLFAPFQLAWRGTHRAWLDAAMVLPEEGKPAWPSLLGTGGNDGRLDFTNNAMQRLNELFDVGSGAGRARRGASQLLEQALWSTACNALVPGAAIGQFLPGGTGGANSTTGPDGDSLVNGWDFVLMLEGAIFFSARTTRRLDPSAARQASAPFAVRAHQVGHGSRGREKTERGEQWLPLWDQPTTGGALEALLGEARLQLGRSVAHRPLDVAKALARLGAARGVTSFVRYGYLERNGQSKIAVPLGRLDVRERPRARLIDDIGRWLDGLQRLASGDHAGTRLLEVEGRVADAAYAALTHDDTPERWQAVLLAAAAVESLQATGTGFKPGPIPPLGPEWLSAADDGSAEWRLACALGSAAASYQPDGRSRDPVRHHWLPLQAGARRFLEKEKRLVRDPRVVAAGREEAAACVAVVQRRLVEAAQRGARALPLVAARGFEARPADLAELIAGRVDLGRTLTLARALMAVRWERAAPPRPDRAVAANIPLDEAWLALRLATLPWPLEKERVIPVDESIVRRLSAGDGSGAVELALRRLRSSGLRPPLRGAVVDEATAALWAASLAFPIGLAVARAMARRFEPTHPTEKR